VKLRCGLVSALPRSYMENKQKMRQMAKEREKVKTRRQLTEDRIALNIAKYNDPSGVSNSLFSL